MTIHDIVIPALQAVTIPMWTLMIVAPHWHVTKRITVPLAAVPTLAGAVVYFTAEAPALFKVLFGSTTAPFANYPGLVEFFAIPNIKIGAWLVVIALDLFVAMWMFHRLHELKAPTWLLRTMALFVFLLPQPTVLAFLVAVGPLLKRRLKLQAGPSGEPERPVSAFV
ncbi:abscisic acid-deficient protein Aba4 family protein [Nocardiopsis chromatogenes]|uniref:abscisic acid-deficient protein Aba4 family protein n=1 Tax=Nocardiopsis chromatogenes TaxID=280239 RepID=UPI00034BD4B3|nr:abscisic acid-deficient protein Aba4 family protein [Nocardiopsis chromatogenes]